MVVKVLMDCPNKVSVFLDIYKTWKKTHITKFICSFKHLAYTAPSSVGVERDYEWRFGTASNLLLLKGILPLWRCLDLMNSMSDAQICRAFNLP